MRDVGKYSLAYYACAGALACALLLLAGCGTGGQSARTAQPEPGVLYQPEFYAQATPEQVKEAIGGRSLADERYVKKGYVQPGRIGIGTMVGSLRFLWSDRELVEYPPVYPLQVAIWHTPYPEVISLMLDAGASTEPLMLPTYVGRPGLKDEIIDILLARSPASLRCETLRAYVRQGDVKRVQYCRALSGVSAVAECQTDKLLSLARAAKQTAVADYLQTPDAARPVNADGI